MPLDAFADEVIALLKNPSHSGEIVVEAAAPFRFAERNGQTAALIASMLAPSPA